MKSFFLTIIGIDTYILESTKYEKTKGFVLAGMTAGLLLPMSFLSSFYMMTYLVNDLLIDALIAVLYSSIVFNFYRFTISSIIWRSGDWEKPADVKPPELSSTLIKVITCSFFIILISKPIELLIFHTGILHWIHDGQAEKGTLYRNFAMLHQHFRVTWVVTGLMLILFLWPILYRSYSSKWGNKEYESKHYEALIAIVTEEFKWFEDQYNHLFRHNKLHLAFSYEERYHKKEHRKFKLSAYRTQFANPPFNTVLKDKIVNTKGKELKESNSKEFFSYLDEIPIQKDEDKV